MILSSRNLSSVSRRSISSTVESFPLIRINSEILELLSFQGNVALKDGKPFLHAHITLGTHNMEVFGGHLFEMEVAAVGEFIIHDFRDETHRKMNDEIGLATLSLCKIEE